MEISDELTELNTPNIVLVADRTYQSNDEVDIYGDSLEMIPDEYYHDIYNALAENHKEVAHYNSPKELIDNIHKHSEDLVMTIYGGNSSRNRMALVPAICESYNVKFVGADAYARILCQDKFLTKEFARRHNITSPYGQLIETENDLSLIESLRLPLIIKPNFEGSSIGISDSSKVASYKEAYRQTLSLLQKFNQPILVEEFQSGKEVCICIIGLPSEPILFEVMEVFCEGQEDFLHERVYSANEKHISDRPYSHRSITEELNPIDKENILKLFSSLGKMDFMRIDGRMNNGKFTLIELTPDAYLGSSSSFKDALLISGNDYQELIKSIIRTALAGYHTPYSNYKES